MKLSRAVRPGDFHAGEVSEWLKEAVSKTVVRATPYRRFKSHPLRHNVHEKPSKAAFRDANELQTLLG